MGPRSEGWFEKQLAWLEAGTHGEENEGDGSVRDQCLLH